MISLKNIHLTKKIFYTFNQQLKDSTLKNLVMAKGMDSKKNVKKEPLKTPKEKKAEKREKKQKK